MQPTFDDVLAGTADPEPLTQAELGELVGHAICGDASIKLHSVASLVQGQFAGVFAGEVDMPVYGPVAPFIGPVRKPTMAEEREAVIARALGGGK